MTAVPEYDYSIEVSATDARNRLPELLDQVDREGLRVYVTRRGRRIGAVVPVDDADRAVDGEDQHWSRRARSVLAAGEPTVPWDEAVRMLETGIVDE